MSAPESDRGAAPAPDALPTLDAQPYLLDAPDDARGVVHALVCDRLLTADGPVWWVDAGGLAGASALARLVPSRRTLDRVQVARGFTPYQHHTLCRRLGTEIEAEYREGAPAPSLIVCPAVDARYRDDDVPRGAARRLLDSAIDHATAVGARHRCPVLFTRAEQDEFTAPVVEACERTIECEQTRFGARVVAPDDATAGTHAYDLGDGWVQTTFAYWRTVLSQRHTAYDTGGADVAEPVAQPREV